MSITMPTGIRVRIEADRRCCGGTATVDDGGDLVCAQCHKRCGRISQRMLELLVAVTAPITAAPPRSRRAAIEGGSA